MITSALIIGHWQRRCAVSERFVKAVFWTVVALLCIDVIVIISCDIYEHLKGINV
jgi:hypothetical protein